MMKCDEEKMYSYQSLSAKALMQTIGNDYHQVLAWMKRANIIESDNHYIAGEKCIGYRFTSYYIRSRTTYVTTSYPIKYPKFELPVGSKVNDGARVRQKLNEIFSTGYLKIDLGAAVKRLEQDYLEERAEILAKGSKANLSKRLVACELKRDLALKVMRRINYTHNTCTVDLFGHRLHTPITRLKKDYRDLVTYRGKHFVEIDLANSQWFFLLWLLDPSNYEYNRKNNVDNKRKARIWEGLDRIRHKETIIMFYENLEKLSGKGFDMCLFRKHVSNGEVYDKVVEEMDKCDGFATLLSQEEKRQYVKSKMLTLLFGCPNKLQGMYKTSKVWECLKKLYPNVTRIIDNIKKVNYKDLSCLLQRIESECIINIICKMIFEKNADMPIITIHDCIATTPEHVLLVKEILLEGIEGFVGIRPKCNIKSWYRKVEDNGNILYKIAS